ncbi:MAG: hypothetical protein JWL62_3810 [Hyphomicrobiales bacterium]|nr:hypothetical protein [Hyphomicrobiales bacterium]
MGARFDEFQVRDVRTIEVDVANIDEISSIRIFAVSDSGNELAFELTFPHLESIVEAAQRAMAKYRAGVREH